MSRTSAAANQSAGNDAIHMQEGKKASGSGEEEEEEESWLYGGGAGSSVISLGGRRAWETPGPSPTRCVRGGGRLRRTIYATH